MRSKSEHLRRSAVKRVAVIGAGASGLCAARWLQHMNIEVVVFERSQCTGGLWVYDDTLPYGGGPAYRSLRTNTSKQITAFSDYPFAPGLPDFPHRSEVLDYLDGYAQSFGTVDCVLLGHRVDMVRLDPNGSWLVAYQSPDGIGVACFDAVLVCTGIFHYPLMPASSRSDTFKGRILHSMEYTSPEEFSDQNVVVVGVGSSGVDIAVELTQVARHVNLSSRSGIWMVPRYIQGRPSDHANTRLAQALPPTVRARVLQHRLTREYRRLGIADHRRLWPHRPPPLGSAAARTTTNDHLLTLISGGLITTRLVVEQVGGTDVRFADGATAPADALIWCTGYRPQFPFLDENIMRHSESNLRLYKHVFHPRFPRLAFIGMCRVQGPAFPIVEMQARWVAHVLAGNVELPPQKHMVAEIFHHEQMRLKTGVPAMRVSLLPYLDDLAREIGVRPNLWRHPELAAPLLFGPPVAAQYRIDGPDKMPEVPELLRSPGSEFSAQF